MSSLSAFSPEKLDARLSAAFYSVVRDRRLWIILIAAVPASLLIYGTMVACEVTHSDGPIEGLYYYHNADWASACGRFLTRYANALTGNVITPILAAVEGILFLCLAVYFIARMWGLQKPIWIVLACFLLLGNPATIAQYPFEYLFAIYCMACLFAVLYSYCIFCGSSWLSVIPSALFLTCALGLYQSYISVAASCAVGCLILSLVDGRPFLYIRRLFVRFLTAGAGGSLLYLILMKLDLAIRHIDAADRTASVSVFDILISLPNQILNAYKTFFSSYFDSTLKRQWLYLLLFFLFFAVIIIWSFRLLQKRSYIRFFCCVLLLILFPVAVNLITLIITFQDTSVLMRYSAVLIFPLAFAIIQRTKAVGWFSWVKLGCAILSAVIFWTYVISANATAKVYDLCYRHCYFETSKMLSDIYDLPDYQDGDRIIFAGFCNYDDLRNELPVLFRYSIGVPTNPVSPQDMNGIMNSRKGYLLNYFGIDAGNVSYDEYTALVTSEEFESMPLWPSEGSVAKINGIVVVKISEDPPVP